MNKTFFPSILILASGIAFAQLAKIEKEELAVKMSGNQVDGISISVDTGWYVEACRNGHLILGYGAGPIDMARIPQDKISFVDVYKRIESTSPNITKDRGKNDVVYANFLLKGESKCRIMQMNPESAIHLFEELSEIAIPYDRERFKMLLEDHPIRRLPENITPSKLQAPSPNPEHLPANRPTQGAGWTAEEAKAVQSGQPSFWPWLGGGVLAVLTALAYFLKSRKNSGKPPMSTS